MMRLISRVRTYASRFGRRIEGFPRGWSPSDFVVLEPASVELDLFPLTFFCKSCRRALRFKTVQEFRSKTFPYGYHCPRCRTGELEQTDLVHYHKCGNLETLVVPKCKDHGDADITLEKFGSNAIKRWMWQCHNPGHPHGPLDLGRVGAHCFKHTPAEMMAHAPFRQGDVYYPESVTLINVSPLGGQGSADERLWKLVLAEYLGIASPGTARRIASRGHQDAAAVSVRETRDKLLKEGIDPALIDRILRELELPPDVDSLQNAIESVGRVVPLSGPSLVLAASQVFEYQEIVALESTTSIQDVVRRAEGPAAERTRSAPDSLRRLGFADAFVTTDFPIIKAVFGYSRGDPERTTSWLRAFPRNEAFPQKTPIYGARIRTEAILLRLDRIRVWKWLRDNEWVGGTQPMNDTDARAWFVNNVSLNSIPTFEEIPPTATVTKWVYRLVHSLSHVLLSQASAIVGIDRNSMGEVLFPTIPALAIYVGGSQEFQLGGMYALFENQVPSWLEVAAEEVTNCLHDPVCLDTDTACFACMFLAETSCEHFNRELGRDVIIGSRARHPGIGYWSVG